MDNRERVESPRPDDVARIILAAFDKHYRLFRGAAQDAKSHFEQADWATARSAVAARIGMYDERVGEAVAELGEKYPALGELEGVWREIVSQSHAPSDTANRTNILALPTQQHFASV